MNIEQVIRRTARCRMTDGTVMVIEFISGFELFNTRPYHNYQTWAQGWRVHGLGIYVEKESLDEAVAEWAEFVALKRDGKDIPSWVKLAKIGRYGGPYRTGVVLDDWITDSKQPTWNDGVK